MKNSFWKKAISLILLATVISGIFQPVQSVYAAEKTISLSQARKLALAGSDSCRRIKSKITLKEVSSQQAIKTIRLKEQNETDFRWSPMFSFQLPEGLNFEEESNMVYKPLQLQTEIKQLTYSLNDEAYRIYEETEQSYLKAYTYQEKVALEEEQLAELKKVLKKNKGRLILGLSVKADVEEIETDIQEAEEKLAQDKKNFINEKEKLGDLIHLDVSTRYTFVNPCIDAEIPRTVLDELIQHTLENDKTYYEAKMETQLSMLQLTENYALLEKQYGSDMDMLSSYFQQIKNGVETDYNAFKTSYDMFLEKIEDNWESEWKILSVSIPKECLKGETSGIRYIEDRPYALYENALEYQQLLEEQMALEKELEKQVKESYEALITARSNYLKLEEQSGKSEEKLKKDKLLNSMGELSFEEYTDSRNQYEKLQIEKLDALELYNSCIFQLNRLTYGAVSEYLNHLENSLETVEDNNRYFVEEEEIQGAEYYMQSLVEDNMFEFGIYLPEDLKNEITHYELRVDDDIVGKKTEISKTIRHLTMVLTGEEKVFVRLYKGEEFVDDCEIDPFIYQGTLKIKDYVIKEAETESTAKEKVIGSYEITSKTEMGLMEIILHMNVAEDIHYYSIQNKDGMSLISEDKKNSITDSFIYLEFSTAEMDSLQIQCYDKEKTLKYTAYFDTKKYEIYKLEEE